MQKFSLVDYMRGGNGTTAPIPTQTFNSSNIFGTVTPQVGDSKASPNYKAGSGGTSTMQVVFVVLFFIFIGYLLYHLSFDK